MSLLLNKLRVKDLAGISVRYKNGPAHWATLRKKKFPRDKALQHFDEFYATVYGRLWPGIRAALLDENHKYVAIVNNYSDPDRIKADLKSQGAMNLKTVYDTFKCHMDEKLERCAKKKTESKALHNLDGCMETVALNAKCAETESIYSNESTYIPESIAYRVEGKVKQTKADSVKQHKNKAPDLYSIEDEPSGSHKEYSRIITSEMDMSLLQEYVPATELKGREGWLLESDYYNHYVRGTNFSINVKKETELLFPKYLHAYTFESDTESRFKAPKKGSTDLLDYYLFDGGSLLPVLALNLQPGDSVLDMCAAPGGKALTILQTLTPRIMVVNDSSKSRVHRIQNILDQYIGGIGWNDRLFVTQQDARAIQDADIYDKILVDVPCTTDRHVLHNDENNLFKPSRIKERIQLPELQTEILVAALKIIRLGGTVVYSTCSLSPVQNAGVVQMALKKIHEETHFSMVVIDMSEALKPLETMYKFCTVNVKYGHTVIPTLATNWGPMYFCKITRVQ